MTKLERALLLGLAEEIVLQLCSRLAEIEELHPRESALGIATFQERMWRIEELLNMVKKDGGSSAGPSPESSRCVYLRRVSVIVTDIVFSSQ
jgi:hypothetical protein